MRANCWYGTEKLRVEEVPDPHIINPRDAVVRITSTAICGSDLHLYDGFIPTMEAGDILGHEFMGEIVELGPGVKNRKVGDRVVCSFPISCGNCFFCKQELFSLCENSNPNAWMAEQMWGHSPCGIYGYSHMVGGYAGGQAQFVRVPFADVGTIVIPSGLTDDQVLFLSDILPTGYMAAEQGDIKPGDTVAVWGAGPVGLFSAKSAQVLGAERIIVIDRFEYRLRLARQHCNADTINYEQESVSEVLNAMTGGRGPDVCIDAVGLEGHMPGLAGLYDKLKTNMFQETDRPPSLRQAILCCRNGGTVSIPGVYGGLLDKMPIGSLINRSLKVRTGQTHVQHYWGKLLELIQNGTIDPTFIITHHLPLDQAPQGYKMFRDKQNECVKVVLRPN
jgi:threonine dehydrogenase-like Zn-dependent dehydrogenase